MKKQFNIPPTRIVSYHVYISNDGIPCAPVKECHVSGDFNGYYPFVVDSCIPFLEDDRKNAIHLLEWQIPESDTFYPVECYLFEIHDGFAKLIKTNFKFF